MGKYLTPQQIEYFHEEGYFVVEDVVDEATIQSIKAEYAAKLQSLAAEMLAAGEVSATYSHLPFAEQFTQLLGENAELFDRLDITLPLSNDGLPPHARAHTGPSVFNLLTHPRLLDVVESIIGPEITSNPVQHVRIKPPRRAVSKQAMENSYIGNTTWHQDMGAVFDEAHQTNLLTVWVAITEATTENGCLVCIPRSHKKNGGALTLHCPGKGIAAENYIPGPLLETRQAIPLPVGQGGVVLLTRYTEHAAYPNKSNALRWSFDLRYNPTGQATGRPAFPSFVARSAQNPASVLTDPARWTQLWDEARDRIVRGSYTGPIYNQERWVDNEKLPVCA